MSISDTYIIPKASRERFIPLSAGPAAPLVEAGVVMAGLSDLGPPYEIARRCPVYHVVLVTLAGRARLETASGATTLSAGSAVILPAVAAHRYLARRGWRIAWFHLNDSGEWAFVKRRAFKVMRAPGAARIAHAMEGILVECASAGAAESAQAAKAYAQVLAVLLRRQVGVDTRGADHVLAWELGELWRRVASDLARRWTVVELAGALGVSPGHLHRLTGRVHGATPMDMVAKMRIERTAELLRCGEFTLAAIAPRVGYETPFALSRAFKRVTGRSPRARQ